MLLFQCGDRSVGWLLTQGTFKPLAFDSVNLVVPSPVPALPHEDFCVELGVVRAGSNEIWNLASLNRVAVEVVQFQAEVGQEQLFCCYTRKYKLRNNHRLSQLYLELPLQWCDFSSADVCGDDDDNPQDDENRRGESDGVAQTKDELSCIDELVSNLTSTPSAQSSGQPGARKRQSASMFVLASY